VAAAGQMTATFQTTAIQQRQTLAMSQVMRLELKLLQMDQVEMAEHVAEMLAENPFLFVGAAIPGATKNAEDTTAWLATPETITSHLMRQIGELRLTEAEREIATALVYSIDDDGYMRESLDEIATLCGSQPLAAEKVLMRLQDLSPTGVFARNIAECFKLQLLARNRYDALIAPLLSHLDLVARRDLAGIMALCGVDAEDASDMVADILSLSARPTFSFVTEVTVAAIPDLIINANAEGQLDVSLNPQALPRIIADDALLSDLSHRAKTKDSVRYIRGQYKNAAWLVAALAKRADTLLAIGKQLAELQTKFLKTARPDHRNALCMTEVATALGLHKSTVSRALRGRTILMDHGKLDALSCFARRINDEAPAATHVQVLERIRKLISTEKLGAARSDEELTFILSRSGLPIARRTVAKYRGLLGIPPASARKAARRNLENAPQGT
jgi:RNA polymerase sigma-54 factor